jgi:hypothetical protein
MVDISRVAIDRLDSARMDPNYEATDHRTEPLIETIQIFARSKHRL